MNTERRYNGKCKKCGTKVSILGTEVPFSVGPEKWIGDRHVELSATDGYNYPLYCGAAMYACPGCKMLRYARPVLGKFRAEKKCSALCVMAIGHDCECACAGKNHGAGHSIKHEDHAHSA